MQISEFSKIRESPNAGYEKVFLDHLENTGSIAQAELAQQVDLQRREWDARAEELEYQQANWESKMQTVASRGKKQWFAAENAFLARWNSEKSEEAARIRDAEKQWDARIAKHQTEKFAWQQNMQTKLAEKVLEEDLGKAIDDLNAQILNNRKQMKADLPLIDRTAALNEAKDKLRRQSLESSRLANVNRGIDDFNINVKLQLQSRALGAGDIYDVMKDFEDEMESHKKNMKVVAKVRILEEYRDLVAKFVASIEQQNDSYENQTRTAALSSGFVQFGDRFIKKGQGSTNVGVVDAITRFNIQSEADQFKQTSQIYASEEQFRRLMKNASMPEFEAILHVEKLKVQQWMTSISGTATDSATRSRTTDPKQLGKFGIWMGRAPDSNHSQGLQHFAGAGMYEAMGAAGVSVAAQSMAGGMGQLGASPARPGSIATPGFYIQLSFWNQTVAQRNAGYVAGLGEIDPISNLVNTFNPVAILATAAHNVEVGERIHGYDRGNLIEANMLDPIDKVLPALGKALDKSVGNFWGQTPLAESIGLALSAGLDVNAQTGDYSMAYNDRAWIELGTQLSATWASWGYGPLPGSLQGALNVANAGFRYDESGNLQDWSIGNVNTADIAGAAIAGAASHYSGQLNEFIGTGFNDSFVNNFGVAMTQEFSSTLINTGAGMINNQIGSHNRYAHMLGGAVMSQLLPDAGLVSAEERAAREAQRRDNNQKAQDILNGWGANMREKLGIVGDATAAVGSVFGSVISGAAWLINYGYDQIVKAGVWLGETVVQGGQFIAERAGNFFTADHNGEYFHWESDQKRMHREILAYNERKEAQYKQLQKYMHNVGYEYENYPVRDGVVFEYESHEGRKKVVLPANQLNKKQKDGTIVVNTESGDRFVIQEGNVVHTYKDSHGNEFRTILGRNEKGAPFLEKENLAIRDMDGNFRQMEDGSIIQIKNGKMRVVYDNEIDANKAIDIFVNGMNANQSKALAYLPAVLGASGKSEIYMVFNDTEGVWKDTGKVRTGQNNPMAQNETDSRIEKSTDVLRNLILRKNVGSIIGYSQGAKIAGNAIIQAYDADRKSTKSIKFIIVGGGHSSKNLPGNGMISLGRTYINPLDYTSSLAPNLSGETYPRRESMEYQYGYKPKIGSTIYSDPHALKNYKWAIREFYDEEIYNTGNDNGEQLSGSGGW